MIEIKEYEDMAMIETPDIEREILSRRLGALVDGFAAIEKIDADYVTPLVTVLNLNNIMREDVAKKLLPRDEILANAPEHYDGFFQVPGTLE